MLLKLHIYRHSSFLSSDVIMDLTSTSDLTQADKIAKLKNAVFIVRAE